MLGYIASGLAFQRLRIEGMTYIFHTKGLIINGGLLLLRLIDLLGRHGDGWADVTSRIRGRVKM